MVGDAADLENYLVAQRGGSEAAAEFEKILDYRGVVANKPIDALAHLQIGWAYVMQGDSAKAKAVREVEVISAPCGRRTGFVRGRYRPSPLSLR